MFIQTMFVTLSFGSFISSWRAVGASGRVGSVLDALGGVDYEYLAAVMGRREAPQMGANKTYQQKGDRWHARRV